MDPEESAKEALLFLEFQLNLGLLKRPPPVLQQPTAQVDVSDGVNILEPSLQVHHEEVGLGAEVLLVVRECNYGPEPEGEESKAGIDCVELGIPLSTGQAARLIERAHPLASHAIPLRVEMAEAFEGVEEQQLGQYDAEWPEHRDWLPAAEGHGLRLRCPALDVEWQ